jgi:uncharacterized protein
MLLFRKGRKVKGRLVAEDLRQYLGSLWLIMEDLYAGQEKEVPFHGWHHVVFVAANARRFAGELSADSVRAEIAGLVHDVNYLVASRSHASSGRFLRHKVLSDIGMTADSIAAIEDIVVAAETRSRGKDISPEAMALSDADTLFKALPITPVILAPLYMRETGSSLRELAEKIVGEQVPLRDSGIYFYSDSAKKKYERWGDVNLALWTCILDALDDVSVMELVQEVAKYTEISGE